jgi:hypothetical protein
MKPSLFIWTYEGEAQVNNVRIQSVPRRKHHISRLQIVSPSSSRWESYKVNEYKIHDVQEVRTSETSVDNKFTRQYIPEDNSEHHTRRRENLKSHEYKIQLYCPLKQVVHIVTTGF